MTETHTTENANDPAAAVVVVKPRRRKLRLIATIVLSTILIAIWVVLVGAMVFPVYLSRH